MTSYLINIMCESDTPEGRGRMTHALHAARDLKAAGSDVKVVFSGIGVMWMTEFHKMEHPFTQHYKPVWDSIQDDIVGVCNFCANGRFKIGDETKALGFDFLGDDGSHLNFSELISDGSQVITF